MLTLIDNKTATLPVEGVEGYNFEGCKGVLATFTGEPYLGEDGVSTWGYKHIPCPYKVGDTVPVAEEWKAQSFSLYMSGQASFLVTYHNARKTIEAHHMLLKDAPYEARRDWQPASTMPPEVMREYKILGITVKERVCEECGGAGKIQGKAPNWPECFDGCKTVIHFGVSECDNICGKETVCPTCHGKKSWEWVFEVETV